MNRTHPLLLIAVCVLMGIQVAGASDRKPLQAAMAWPEVKNLDVPYVPTPEKVVSKMLDMAEVGRDDLVYDLGCGDGRIVIAAARRKGARGVGIDIDPDRIRESRENARKAGVAGRVEFLQQDLFSADISRATVVMLYLLPSVNLQLRPKILRELHPGTRVVSHSHDMGLWKADQHEQVEGRDIYFWIVPANVTGAWEWTVQDGQDRKKCGLRMSQRFQEVTGTFCSGNTETPLRDIQLTGRRLSFTVDQVLSGRKAAVQYEGRVVGDSIDGRIRPGDGAITGGMTWKAARVPSTMTPIDRPD